MTELDENQFETGLRELIGMMKCRDDRKVMQNYCMEHADRFANIDDATYDLICTMLHIHSLKTKKNSNRNLKGGKINMCKAFDDWAKEEQEKGRKDGIRIGEKRGERRGERRGEKRGERRAAALMSRLIDDKRFEDVHRAANSAAVRKKLYLEYEM